MLCCSVVCNCFNQAHINAEGVFNQLLAVSGNGASGNLDAVAAQGVDMYKLFLYYLHGIALVGAVEGIEYFLFVGKQYHFGCGASTVDTKICIAAI